MTDRAASRLAWWLFAIPATLIVPHLIVTVESRGVLDGDIILSLVAAVLAVGYAALGALIVSRPRNVVGWTLLAIGVVLGVAGFGEDFSLWSRSVSTDIPLFTVWVTWVANWMFPLIVIPIGLLFLLFPTGRVHSRRWRFVPPALFVGGALAVLVAMFQPGKISEQPGVSDLQNPVGLKPLGSLLSALGTVAAIVNFTALLLGIVSLLFRFRRARGEERQQLKWLVYVTGAAAVLFGINALQANVIHDDSIVNDVIFTTWVLLLVAGLPIAAAIAVFRYRLYEIDVVINKTVVYGALAVFITLVYVGIVVGIGTAIGQGDRPNLGLSILATAVVAVAFQPVRERVQRFANRLVYGKRATPYEVLSHFAERMASTYAADELLPQMAKILGEGTGAVSADVWLKVGNELRVAGSWPGEHNGAKSVQLRGDDEPVLPGGDVSVPVRDKGELLGALSIGKSRTESVTEGDRKLLADLASQAGLVLRNVKLIEELRASRQRIVSAQDEERRRIERNIHDGAQQQLVALNVKLGLARMLASKDLEKTEALIDQLQQETQDALDNLRDLARGIYPPLLADKGLVAALEAQVRKASVRVAVEANGVGRYPQDTEAAVYFCVLEALQNVAKYANASTAVVRLERDDGALVFEVRDDGKGFDAKNARPGSGMTNMADRVEALGGELNVQSSPGQGTTVRGTLPIPVRTAP